MSSTTVMSTCAQLELFTHRLSSTQHHINRFPQRFRPEIEALAAIDPKIADLAVSFPALLFKLAVPARGQDLHLARQAILDGKSLTTAAKLACLPMWTRKLLPEAFIAPIPTLPNEDLVRRQIGNFIPASTKQQRLWLAAVGKAYRIGDAQLALWAAKAFQSRRTSRDLELIGRIAFWGWFSLNQTGRASDLIDKRWNPSMEWKSAHAAAMDWESNLDLYLDLGGGDIADLWFEPMVFEDYEILPILSSDGLIEETRAMKHCVRKYGGRMRRGACRIWSVRKAGYRIATLELGRHISTPLLTVVQFVGPENAPIKDEAVWAVVCEWMRRNFRNSVRPFRKTSDQSRIGRWTELWRSYWLAKRRIPMWLPLRSEYLSLWNI